MSGLPSDRRGLRISLAAGAAYDLALGGFILLAGKRVMAALGHPVPEPGFYYTLGALPLLILPVLYGSAARSSAIDAFRPAVLWARGGGGLLLLGLTQRLGPEPAWIFLTIGLLDIGWAVVHRVLWRAPRH